MWLWLLSSWKPTDSKHKAASLSLSLSAESKGITLLDWFQAFTHTHTKAVTHTAQRAEISIQLCTHMHAHTDTQMLHTYT